MKACCDLLCDSGGYLGLSSYRYLGLYFVVGTNFVVIFYDCGEIIYLIVHSRNILWPLNVLDKPLR